MRKFGACDVEIIPGSAVLAACSPGRLDTTSLLNTRSSAALVGVSTCVIDERDTGAASAHPNASGRAAAPDQRLAIADYRRDELGTAGCAAGVALERVTAWYVSAWNAPPTVEPG